jgi:hypothetical protein
MSIAESATLRVAETLNVRDLLLDDDTIAGVRRWLAGSGVSERLVGLPPGTGDAARRLVEERLAGVVPDVLDVDLAGAAVAGWRAHPRLLTAARQTLAVPGLSAIVALVAHRIEVGWQPRVEIVVGGQAVADMPFRIDAAFDVVGLRAVVSRGRLIWVGGGRCTLTIRFGAGGHVLAERAVTIDPALAVPLDGVVLVDEDGR